VDDLGGSSAALVANDVMVRFLAPDLQTLSSLRLEALSVRMEPTYAVVYTDDTWYKFSSNVK
jgi:hypothetical protein